MAQKTEEEWTQELLDTKRRQREQLENFAKKIDEVQKRRDAVKAEVDTLQREAEQALDQERGAGGNGKKAMTKEEEAKEDAVVDALSDCLSFSAKKSYVRHQE
jgi:dsDNA-specific endonuclease/ATPase MutS2